MRRCAALVVGAGALGLAQLFAFLNLFDGTWRIPVDLIIVGLLCVGGVLLAWAWRRSPRRWPRVYAALALGGTPWVYPLVLTVVVLIPGGAVDGGVGELLDLVAGAWFWLGILPAPMLVAACMLIERGDPAGPVDRRATALLVVAATALLAFYVVRPIVFPHAGQITVGSATPIVPT